MLRIWLEGTYEACCEWSETMESVTGGYTSPAAMKGSLANDGGCGEADLRTREDSRPKWPRRGAAHSLAIRDLCIRVDRPSIDGDWISPVRYKCRWEMVHLLKQRDV